MELLHNSRILMSSEWQFSQVWRKLITHLHCSCSGASFEKSFQLLSELLLSCRNVDYLTVNWNAKARCAPSYTLFALCLSRALGKKPFSQKNCVCDCLDGLVHECDNVNTFLSRFRFIKPLRNPMKFQILLPISYLSTSATMKKLWKDDQMKNEMR